MSITEAIRASYGLPIVKWRDVLRAFWPLVVVVAFIIWVTIDGMFPLVGTAKDGEAALAFLFVLGALYLAFLTARGAVSWHRSLILGTPVPITPPWPNWRAVVYGLLVVLIGIAQALLQAFVVIPIALALLGAGDEAALGMGAPHSPANLAIILVSYLAYAFAITVVAGLLMSLPGTALKGTSGDDRGERIIYRRYVAWVLIATTLAIPFAMTMVSLIVPFSSVPLLIGSTVLHYYASIVALSGLSMAYRYGTTMPTWVRQDGAGPA